MGFLSGDPDPAWVPPSYCPALEETPASPCERRALRPALQRSGPLQGGEPEPPHRATATREGPRRTADRPSSVNRAAAGLASSVYHINAATLEISQRANHRDSAGRTSRCEFPKIWFSFASHVLQQSLFLPCAEKTGTQGTLFLQPLGWQAGSPHRWKNSAWF